MFASRVQPGLQILSAANFVCNLCNRYLKLLQLFASAVLWCKHSCMYLQSLQIKVAYLTTKVSCNHWLQQLHPECNWTRNTSKSCSFGHPNIYSALTEVSPDQGLPQLRFPFTYGYSQPRFLPYWGLPWQWSSNQCPLTDVSPWLRFPWPMFPPTEVPPQTRFLPTEISLDRGPQLRSSTETPANWGLPPGTHDPSTCNQVLIT